VVLPLGETRSSARGLGTRHLAALATSETTDAVAVVVSEETGTISLANDGELFRHLDEGELSRLLYRLSITPPTPAERLIAPLVREASRGLRGMTEVRRFPISGQGGRASGMPAPAEPPDRTDAADAEPDDLEPADDAEHLLKSQDGGGAD
jgi:hypothetical protein